MPSTNYLSFEITNLHNCRLESIVDTSTYLNSDTVESPVLQIVLPGTSPSGDVIELNYYLNSVTVLNSNTVGLTNVDNPKNLVDLPDGLWTGKISICPYTQFWFEKKWFRTCKLRCKYYKAFLKLKINNCSSCYNKQTASNLDYAWRLIQGIQANTDDCNYKNAAQLYSVANSILDVLLECECNNSSTWNKANCNPNEIGWDSSNIISTWSW